MFGLDVDTLRQLRDCFAELPQIEKVLIHGSRAKQNYRRGSDIDITLIGKNLTQDNTIAPLTSRIDDLYLPYQFDISIFSDLKKQEFIARVLSTGKTLYRREPMTERWDTLPFAESILNVTPSIKIPRKQFNGSGPFPIVSQEKALINGYCSDRSAVISVKSPMVVFGDHTQILKYIDFDFAVGADGVKILQPKPFLQTKFCYYFLMENRTVALGYARHYRLLKDLFIKFPPLPEQKRIVEILDKAFAAIETAIANTKKNIANAQELFNNELNRIFSQDGDAGKDGWNTLPFSECVLNIKPPTKIPRSQFNDSGSFPIISQEKSFINGYCSDKSAIVSVKSPLIVFGDHTQTLKYIDFDFVVGADGVKVLQPKPFLQAKFFYYFLMGNRTTTLGYARHYRLMKELLVKFPTLPKQKKIVARLDKLAEKQQAIIDTYTRKLAALAELKQSVLHRAFTGELTANIPTTDHALSEVRL